MPLGRTARYYKNGTTIKGKSKPANSKRAKAVKKKKDTEVNARPEQRAKRSELVTERRKRGIYGKGGKDLAHTSNGIKAKDSSENRGSKSDSPGDKRARAKGRKNPNLGPKKKKK